MRVIMIGLRVCATTTSRSVCAIHIRQNETTRLTNTSGLVIDLMASSLVGWKESMSTKQPSTTVYGAWSTFQYRGGGVPRAGGGRVAGFAARARGARGGAQAARGGFSHGPCRLPAAPARTDLADARRRRLAGQDRR